MRYLGNFISVFLATAVSVSGAVTNRVSQGVRPDRLLRPERPGRQRGPFKTFVVRWRSSR